MHYRIEPPADWIVSSSEDESLSSIDIDLSEFDDTALFTQDSDLLKCTACDTFWSFLDNEGMCLLCLPNVRDEVTSTQHMLPTNDIGVLDNDTFSTWTQPALDIDFEYLFGTNTNTSELEASTRGIFEEQLSTPEASTSGVTATTLATQGHANQWRSDSTSWRHEMPAPLSACNEARKRTSISDRGKRMRGRCWKCTLQSPVLGRADSICQRCINIGDRLNPPSLSGNLEMPFPDSVLENFNNSFLSVYHSCSANVDGLDMSMLSPSPNDPSGNTNNGVEQEDLALCARSIDQTPVSNNLSRRPEDPVPNAQSRESICSSCRPRNAAMKPHQHRVDDPSDPGYCQRCGVYCKSDRWCIEDCTKVDSSPSRWLI
jgi:hypothetical protein